MYVCTYTNFSLLIIYECFMIKYVHIEAFTSRNKEKPKKKIIQA